MGKRLTEEQRAERKHIADERKRLEAESTIRKYTTVVEMIRALSPVWSSKAGDAVEQARVETQVGAMVFYYGAPKELAFTGMVSQLLADNPKMKKVVEHIYPRKLAGRELLAINWDKVENPVEHYVELLNTKYGRYHLVTAEENVRLKPHQKEDTFTGWERAYELAGIVLVNSKK